jgi:hypothetical protein
MGSAKKGIRRTPYANASRLGLGDDLSALLATHGKGFLRINMLTGPHGLKGYRSVSFRHGKVQDEVYVRMCNELVAREDQTNVVLLRRSLGFALVEVGTSDHLDAFKPLKIAKVDSADVSASDHADTKDIHDVSAKKKVQGGLYLLSRWRRSHVKSNELGIGHGPSKGRVRVVGERSKNT